MKELTLFCVLTFIATYTVGELGLWDDFQKRAETVHNYEYKSLQLAKQVRQLQVENETLRFKVEQLQAEKEHLAFNNSGKEASRTIASIPTKNANDLVNFELYKWSADKLLGVGKQALHFKKYEKSAQYYHALLKHYPSNKSIDDKVLFEAGIAAYESGKHYDWAQAHFNKLLTHYPKSDLHRGAKLWLALSHFYQGDQEKFVATVDEFRKKYRNTKEWKVLSKYYEELNYKYKK